MLGEDKDPNQALTASVQDALRLGCCAVGFTIYPGSAHQLEMYGQFRAYAEEAKRNGLAVVIWSYPRGSGLSKDGETAIDVAGYAVQIAAQLGAHIIKVKLPTAHIEQDAARKVYDERRIPIATPAERVRHVVDCAFAGRGSSSSRAGLPSSMTTSCSMRSVPSMPAGGSVRSLAATHSNVRRRRRSGCWGLSWILMRRCRTGIGRVERAGSAMPDAAPQRLIVVHRRSSRRILPGSPSRFVPSSGGSGLDPCRGDG